VRCPRRADGLRQEGEAADPDALWLDHGDAAIRQRIGQHRQVVQEERDLLVRAPLGTAAKRITEGLVARLDASSVPKSVSAETTIRSSSAARSKIASSEAA
jgi:hypothetical protein